MEKVTIATSEGTLHSTRRDAIELSSLVRNIIADTDDDAVVPLANVNDRTLEKVLEYCEHACDRETEADVKYVLPPPGCLPDDKDRLFELVLAANFMDIPGLLDAGCQKVADMLKGKTPEQIRETFNIETAFTQEEEAEVRRENAWAFP